MNARLAILLMIGASFFFALMSLVIKKLNPAIPPGELAFFRSIFGVIVFIPYMLIKRISIFGSHKKELILRGVSGAFASMCCFYALTYISIAEATTLFRSAALYVPFFAYLIIGEKIKFKGIFCAVFGFFGILLILKPGISIVSFGSLLALVGSILAALAWVSVKGLSNKENSMTIILYFLITSAFLNFVLFYSDFVLPNINQSLIIVVFSIIATLAQILLTLSYKYGEASIVSPILYSEIVFSAIFDLVFYNHFPDILSILGIIIITINSIYLNRAK